MDADWNHLRAAVILWSTNFQWIVDEDDAIKCHGRCCIFGASKLDGVM